MIVDGRRTAGTEVAEDVDGLRISPGRMRVCSRSPVAISGDSRIGERCHGEVRLLCANGLGGVLVVLSLW